MAYSKHFLEKTPKQLALKSLSRMSSKGYLSIEIVSRKYTNFGMLLWV